MGISIDALGSAYGMSFMQPMNYTIKNQSEVSEDYAKRGTAGLISNVSPVGYPNAKAVSDVAEEDSNPLELAINSVMKSQEAGKAYNDVAQKFQNMTVGYGQDLSAQTYGTAGSALDLFA